MQLKVLRQTYTTNSTIGSLFVDGQFECFTLEDVVRPTKIYGETAIPAGRYRVVVTFSPAFKRRLPLLVDVPQYSGVRIHPGNTKRDTLGCLLVGQGKGADVISASRAAFDALLPKIEKAALKEEVIIEIVDGGTPVGAVATRSRSGPPAGVELDTPWSPPPARRGGKNKPAAKRKSAAGKKKPAAAKKRAAASKAPVKRAAAAAKKPGRQAAKAPKASKRATSRAAAPKATARAAAKKGGSR